MPVVHKLTQRCTVQSGSHQPLCGCLYLFIFIFIQVQLIYNIILISSTWHSDSKCLQIILHLQLLYDMGYIPCAVQYILVSYLFYTQQSAPLNPLPYLAPAPFPLPIRNHQFVLYICESISFLFTSLFYSLDLWLFIFKLAIIK